MKIIFIFLTLINLSSCASGSKFNISEIENQPIDSAIVIFYWPYLFFGPGSKGLPVLINGIKSGKLNSGVYFKKAMLSGTYKIHTNIRSNHYLVITNEILTITLKAGKTYFVRYHPKGRAPFIKTTFEVVYRDEAMTELIKTRVQR